MSSFRYPFIHPVGTRYKCLIIIRDGYLLSVCIRKAFSNNFFFVYFHFYFENFLKKYLFLYVYFLIEKKAILDMKIIYFKN